MDENFKLKINMDTPQSIGAIIEEMRKSGKLVILTPTELQKPPVMAQPIDYETEHRKRIIAKLCHRIAEKRLSVAVVADWVNKSENYCQTQITKRSRFTKTVWAVDALKFVCNEWQMPLPETYEMQIKKFSRQDERKKQRINRA